MSTSICLEGSLRLKKAVIIDKIAVIIDKILHAITISNDMNTSYVDAIP